MQHVWEEVGGALWENVEEDEHGNLISSTGTTDPAEAVRRRRRRLARTDFALSNRRVVRDMIRYLYLLVDVSRCMREKDPALPPGTRLEVVLNLALDFVSEYFDQNPLSHLGVIVLKDGEAEMLTQLSGSMKVHKVALAAAARDAAGSPPTSGGEFSLQNGLEAAGRSLGRMPRHGSREVVVLCGALSTCDPGDVVVETLPRLKSAGVRVSTVALAAEMHVCRKISEETGGVMGVCLDRNHLRDLVMGQCIPPPALPGADEGLRKRPCEFVNMGFPTRESGDVPSLIHATRDKKMFTRTGYLCPRCKAKAAELPSDCAVCGLKLVLAPHLARSFHHLFPVPPFVEVPEDVVVGKEGEVVVSNRNGIVRSSCTSGGNGNKKTRTIEIDSTILVSSKECDRACYACLKVIGVKMDDDRKVGSSARSPLDASNQPETLRFQCPDCLNVFCADCDAYLHETIHNCPGCLCKG